MATLKDRELYSGREGNQTVVYTVTKIPLVSLQRCRDFETRKLACNVILLLYKLHRTRKVLFK